MEGTDSDNKHRSLLPRRANYSCKEFYSIDYSGGTTLYNDTRHKDTQHNDHSDNLTCYNNDNNDITSLCMNDKA